MYALSEAPRRVDTPACAAYEPPGARGRAWYFHPESDCFFVDAVGQIGDGCLHELGPAITEDSKELGALLHPGSYAEKVFLSGRWGSAAHLPPAAVAPPPPAPLLAYTRVPAGPGYATILPDFDFESYSEAGYYWDGPASRWRGLTKTKPGIFAVGAPVYTEHPSCEVISLAYDLKDGSGDKLWKPGMAPPQDLFDHIISGGLLEAWNSSFEYYLWKNVCNARMGWPALDYRQLRCAMSKARAHSLPGALKNAAKALGSTEQKDTRGDALIRKLTVPRSPSKKQINEVLRTPHDSLPIGGPDAVLRRVNRATPENSPQDFADFYEYNRQDIKAEASVSARCPDLSPRELELWLVDQAINYRGVHIDQEALGNCIAIYNQASERYTLELREITGGTVQSAGELEKIRGWLGAHGVHTASLDSDAVEACLKRTDLSPWCRRVLEIRDSLGSASVKKLFAIERMLCRDGRLRDLFAFCGADRTGRWAGRGPQPQNLPSSGPKVCRCTCGRVFWKGLVTCPTCSQLRSPTSDCDWGAEATEAALADIATRSLEHVEARWGNALAAICGCLRGLFSAAPDHELICSDFSAIEAVTAAELSGETWRQEVFRTHGKIYEMSASKITGTPFEEILDYKKKNGVHHPLRKKIGKVSELASIYGGGLGAWKAFGADAFLTDEEISEGVRAWRLASPAIAQQRDDRRGLAPGIWYGIQEAAYSAISCPGTVYSHRGLNFGVKDEVLYVQLLSGRMLTYHQPRLEQGVTSWGKTTIRMTYSGWNSNYLNGPIGWTRMDTYGPKIFENINQATARDIMAHNMPELERAGYRIVIHVHDEIVAEVLTGGGSIEEFERIMAKTPPWAEGWPVKAAGGWRGRRYRKE